MNLRLKKTQPIVIIAKNSGLPFCELPPWEADALSTELFPPIQIQHIRAYDKTCNTIHHVQRLFTPFHARPWGKRGESENQKAQFRGIL